VISVEYKLKTKFKSKPNIYRKILGYAMRQRHSGTENVCCSNARFWYQSQGVLPVESIEKFDTEKLMAST